MSAPWITPKVPLPTTGTSPREQHTAPTPATEALPARLTYRLAEVWPGDHQR